MTHKNIFQSHIYKLYVYHMIIRSIYMPKCQIETTGLYIRISDILIKKLDSVAVERGFNRSEFIRHLIQNAIEKEERK